LQFSDNFLTDSCEVLTVEIMGTQKFDFALKFTENGVFSPRFCISDDNLPTRRFLANFSTAKNLDAARTTVRRH